MRLDLDDRTKAEEHTKLESLLSEKKKAYKTYQDNKTLGQKQKHQVDPLINEIGELKAKILNLESIQNDSIDSFISEFVIKEKGLEILLFTLEEIKGEQFNSKRRQELEISFQNVLSKAINRIDALSKPDTNEDLKKFLYKPDNKILHLDSDIAILSQFVGLAFSPRKGLFAKSEHGEQVVLIAKKLNEMYFVNSLSKNRPARLFPKEETPLLGYVTDLLVAGSIFFDSNLYIKLFDWIREGIQGHHVIGVIRDQVKLELLQLYKNSYREEVNFQTDILTPNKLNSIDPFELGANMTKEIVLAMLERTGNKFMVGNYYDRLKTLFLANEIARELKTVPLIVPENQFNRLGNSVSEYFRSAQIAQLCNIIHTNQLNAFSINELNWFTQSKNGV